MRGISIYLGKDFLDNLEPYLKKVREIGFSSIFTSLHIPEDDPALYRERLQELGRLAVKYDMELKADISPESLGHLGFTWETAEGLLDWGLKGLRIDYGINEKTVVELSAKMKIALNASTLTKEGLKRLKDAGLRTEAVEAWHNFYPRPETGLDASDFHQTNQWLQSENIKVMAFIPGDGKRRGPLFKGLPTLEDHRNHTPFAAYLDLEKSRLVDKILVGDNTLSENSFEQFSVYQKGILQLRAEALTAAEVLLETAANVHTNRWDSARDCVRSMESREYGLFETRKLSPENTIERTRGSITVDNINYGRYQGELQIAKRNLPADEKVNVIGKLCKEDMGLLDHIKRGVKFQVKWV